jgi:hypothetical protein
MSCLAVRTRAVRIGLFTGAGWVGTGLVSGDKLGRAAPTALDIKGWAAGKTT